MAKYSDLSVSVIIPTYNRPTLLLQALKSLQEQSFTAFDIVVIDNVPNPHIAQSLNGFNRTAKVPVKYIPEPNLGAHHARHAGARASISEVLLFGDDDQTFDQEWVSAYSRTFSEHPDMVAAAGPVRPRWLSPPPEWISRLMKGRKIFPILGLIDLQSGFQLGEGGIIFSGNMAIRRTTLFELGGFAPDLVGEELLGNGETGLNQKLREQRMLVGYVPDAVVYHHIPADRMTLDYFRRRIANEGACDMYSRFHKCIPGRLRLSAFAAFIMLRNSTVRIIESLVASKTDRWSLRIQLQAARWQGQLQYVSRLMQDKNFRQFVLKHDWLNDSCTS